MRFFERRKRRKQFRECYEVLRSHDNADQLPAIVKAAIHEHTGVAPREGEGMLDYVARAIGQPRERVERFMALIEQGYTIQEAEGALPAWEEQLRRDQAWKGATDRRPC